MPGIFISYRRGDSIGHTGRLYDLLCKHFGSAHVFMDIDTIGPGENFVEVIEKTCDSCEVLLAVVGRSWITASDQNGNRRLEDPGDFVRLEISHALQRGIRVVPVLVDGAQMPDAKAFPDELKEFARRNAWEITDKRFHHDVNQLIETLHKMQPTLQRLAGPDSPTPAAGAVPAQHAAPASRKGIYIGIGAVVILLVAMGAYLGWFKAASPASTGKTGSFSAQTYDIPSLQASVTGPLLFFTFSPNRQLPPPGQRPYATSFRSSLSSGKSVFWEVALNFQGQFPPPDYQIQSIWYRGGQEVFRGVGAYKGSVVPERAYHNRFAWAPPGGRLQVGDYRVDLLVSGQKIATGNFAVQP